MSEAVKEDVILNVTPASTSDQTMPGPCTPDPEPEVKPPLRIDFGCGDHKVFGCLGVDRLALPGVDLVMDFAALRPGVDRFELLEARNGSAIFEPWPWETSSVDEAFCEHVLEHLWPAQRVHFFNELHRVLKPGAQCTVITPHWCSHRAYGDLDHKFPPVSEQFYASLEAEWRHTFQPHLDKAFTCNFKQETQYKLADWLLPKNDEFRSLAINAFKEAASDLIGKLTAIK